MNSNLNLLKAKSIFKLWDNILAALADFELDQSNMTIDIPAAIKFSIILKMQIRKIGLFGSIDRGRYIEIYRELEIKQMKCN